MGGVNFTRNRAWWHTAIWDEYGQRHQYLCIIPSIIYMVPSYWYGSFINRSIEQNYAAKMYQLDFEARRNRLTHNMIMEHFESHVEKVQDLLDEVKTEGFEKTFDYEIKNPFNEYIDHKLPKMNDEFIAELAEFSGLTYAVDEFCEHFDVPYWKRQELEKYIIRRKTPRAPYKYINQIRDFNNFPIMDVYIDPHNQFMMTKKGTVFPVPSKE